MEKTPVQAGERQPSVTDYRNIAFMGNSVISGSAAAVVLRTGDRTLFGSMASAVAGEAAETSFTKGVNAVSFVLIRFMMVMVPLVFLINGLTKGDWLEAFLFGIVDVAKESADIILLQKDLMVLEQGIIEGRKTYANMIKYIKMTASSNFGNMFSVLVASALLPFLPMVSIQLILLNLIYDLSCTAIPWDNVDDEYLRIPRKWDASSVGSFMIWIGPTSSIFDFTTYIFMYFVFCPLFVSGGVLYKDLAAHFSGAELLRMQSAYAALFQAGWFVESMWSQTLAIHMIRTPKLPFLQSRASAPVTLLTCAGIAALTLIPFTPFGRMLGFAALPLSYFAYLLPCILLYMALATSLKKAYVRHYGELL